MITSPYKVIVIDHPQFWQLFSFVLVHKKTGETRRPAWGKHYYATKKEARIAANLFKS